MIYIVSCVVDLYSLYVIYKMFWRMYIRCLMKCLNELICVCEIVVINKLLLWCCYHVVSMNRMCEL